MGYTAAFLDLIVGLLENAPQRARTAGGDSLRFGLVADSYEHGDRLAVTCDEYRLLTTGLQVAIELRRDLCGRGSLHNVTSSPQTRSCRLCAMLSRPALCPRLQHGL